MPGGEMGSELAPPKTPLKEAGQRVVDPAPPNAAHSIEQWVAKAAAAGAAVPDIERQGSVENPIVVNSPTSAQRLIEAQQAQLGQMRRQVEASEAALQCQFDNAVAKAARKMAEGAAA